MNASITDQTVNVDFGSLEDVLSQHPGKRVQVELSVSLPENPGRWLIKVTALAQNGGGALLFRGSYNPTDEATPYGSWGPQFGVSPAHELYTSLAEGGKFPVEQFLDWVTEAQLQLHLKGIDTDVSVDLEDDTESNAPQMPPQGQYRGVPPY